VNVQKYKFIKLIMKETLWMATSISTVILVLPDIIFFLVDCEFVLFP
jgi:hypothetical protein